MEINVQNIKITIIKEIGIIFEHTF